MVLGDAVTKLQRFVWIFNHVSRVITWSLFNLRAPNLVKWPISTWPFIWWCQFIDKFKFETRPSFLRNSEMANRWAQLHSVTEIAPPHPFLCVNKSPIGYGFRGGGKAIRWRSLIVSVSRVSAVICVINRNILLSLVQKLFITDTYFRCNL